MRFLVLIVLCACSLDDSLSETTQEVSMSHLKDQGYICRLEGAVAKCRKCVPVTNEDGSISRSCAEYTCYSAPPPDYETCTRTSLEHERRTYEFEGEAGARSGGHVAVAQGAASAGGALDLATTGTTRFDFEAAYADDLVAWVRVTSASASAFALQLDALAQRVEVPGAATWTWVRLDGNHAIESGTHTLRIHTIDAGVKIDRILLVNDPSFTPVVHTVQAEAYGWVAPMTSGTTKTFPATTYIWVPNGAGSGGFAQLEVAVPADGYHVWGRFHAPTEADNAFDIARFLEERQRWDVPVSASWRWHRAPMMFALEPSSIVEIAQREDGTKLDKLVFTNDPGFLLVE